MTETKREIDVHEAAAFWGGAQNVAYPPAHRLSMALTALDFFGAEYEKREELSTINVVMSVPQGTWPASVTNYSVEVAVDLIERYSDEVDFHFFLAEVSL